MELLGLCEFDTKGRTVTCLADIKEPCGRRESSNEADLERGQPQVDKLTVDFDINRQQQW